MKDRLDKVLDLARATYPILKERGCQSYGCCFYSGLVESVCELRGEYPMGNMGVHSCMGHGGVSGFSGQQGNSGETKQQMEIRYRLQQAKEERELREARNKVARRIFLALAKGCLIVWEEEEIEVD